MKVCTFCLPFIIHFNAFLKPFCWVFSFRKKNAGTAPVIVLPTVIIIKVPLYTLIYLVLSCIYIHPVWLFFCFHSIILLILFKYWFLWVVCIMLCLGNLGLYKCWTVSLAKNSLKRSIQDSASPFTSWMSNQLGQCNRSIDLQ